MTNTGKTGGIIYDSMKKYRRKFLVIELFLTLFLIWYFLMCQEYIINVFEGPVAFDEARFSSEVGTVAVGEPFELHRSDNVTVSDSALRADSYWQGSKYEFNVDLKEVKKLSVDTLNKTTLTGDDDEGDEVSGQLYVAQIGGKRTLVLAYPHVDVDKLSSVSGIFVNIPLIIAHDVAQYGDFKPTDEICEYMLDTRGLEMEGEYFDVSFVAFLLITVLYLGTKLALQYKNFLYTPTYSQLAKYGDPLVVEEKVESELKLATKDKKQLVCENWIVSKDTFKLKIVKNHMKSGTFKYTPENY